LKYGDEIIPLNDLPIAIDFNIHPITSKAWADSRSNKRPPWHEEGFFKTSIGNIIENTIPHRTI
jgi:hypothetical protein